MNLNTLITLALCLLIALNVKGQDEVFTLGRVDFTEDGRSEVTYNVIEHGGGYLIFLSRGVDFHLYYYDFNESILLARFPNTIAQPQYTAEANLYFTTRDRNKKTDALWKIAQNDLNITQVSDLDFDVFNILKKEDYFIINGTYPDGSFTGVKLDLTTEETTFLYEPNTLSRFQGTFYLETPNGYILNHGDEVFYTDGTSDGTEKILSNFGLSDKLISISNNLIYISDRNDIYLSDGTFAGTSLLTDSSFPSDFLPTDIYGMISTDDGIVYLAKTTEYGTRLYQYTASTENIQIFPHYTDTIYPENYLDFRLNSSSPNYQTQLLTFRTNNDNGLSYFWQTDGTENGTLLFDSLNTDNIESNFAFKEFFPNRYAFMGIPIVGDEYLTYGVDLSVDPPETTRLPINFDNIPRDYFSRDDWCVFEDNGPFENKIKLYNLREDTSISIILGSLDPLVSPSALVWTDSFIIFRASEPNLIFNDRITSVYSYNTDENESSQIFNSDIQFGDRAAFFNTGPNETFFLARTADDGLKFFRTNGIAEENQELDRLHDLSGSGSTVKLFGQNNYLTHEYMTILQASMVNSRIDTAILHPLEGQDPRRLFEAISPIGHTIEYFIINSRSVGGSFWGIPFHYHYQDTVWNVRDNSLNLFFFSAEDLIVTPVVFEDKFTSLLYANGFGFQGYGLIKFDQEQQDVELLPNAPIVDVSEIPEGAFIFSNNESIIFTFPDEVDTDEQNILAYGILDGSDYSYEVISDLGTEKAVAATQSSDLSVVAFQTQGDIFNRIYVNAFEDLDASSGSELIQEGEHLVQIERIDDRILVLTNKRLFRSTITNPSNLAQVYQVPNDDFTLSKLTVVDDETAVFCQSSESGMVLIETNGFPGGTTSIQTIPASFTYQPEEPIDILENWLCFTAVNSDGTREVILYDYETNEVEEINAPDGFGYPDEVYAAYGRFYFMMTDEFHGREIHYIDLGLQRGVTGTVYHDLNENGSQDAD
ncbi:MAG: hypothetical protein AAGF87_11005, partial [Bacteroidota bacterium]